MESQYTRKEVLELLDINANKLNRYQKQGLFQISYDESGRRIFNSFHLKLIKEIQQYEQMGFDTREIHTILNMSEAELSVFLKDYLKQLNKQASLVKEFLKQA